MQRFWDKLRRVTLTSCFKCLKRLKHWNTQSQATHCVKNGPAYDCLACYSFWYTCVPRIHIWVHMCTRLHFTIHCQTKNLFYSLFGSKVNREAASWFTCEPGCGVFVHRCTKKNNMLHKWYLQDATLKKSFCA